MGYLDPPEHDYPEGLCEVCGQDLDNCVCPECPVCGSAGDPGCYCGHGLIRTEEQKFLREVCDRQIIAEIESERRYCEEAERLWQEELKQQEEEQEARK